MEEKKKKKKEQFIRLKGDSQICDVWRELKCSLSQFNCFALHVTLGRLNQANALSNVDMIIHIITDSEK